MPVFEIRTLFYIEMYLKLLYLYTIRALNSNAIRSDYYQLNAVKDVSFDWSHHSVSSAYSKVRNTALHKIPSFTLGLKGSTKIRLLRVRFEPSTFRKESFNRETYALLSPFN